MADFSALPEELIRSILSKLPLSDFFRSGAVCKSWHSIYRGRSFPGGSPWLVLGYDDPETQTRGFFSLADQKTHRPELPEAIGKRCFPCTRGWMVTVGPDLKIHLLHPFLRTQIPLPPPPPECLADLEDVTDETEELLDCLLLKVILTSDPRSRFGDCVVIAIFGISGYLAICRLEDESWTLVSKDLGWYPDPDVIYFKGQVYAISSTGQVFTCDISPELKLTWVAHEFKGDRYSHNYLVYSAGDLLLVLRNHGHILCDGGYHFLTRRFQVFKLDMNSETWMEVKSIGNQALFLGFNNSVSISAEAFPGCKGNSIYFADDSFEKNMRYGFEDVGLYHLEDGKIDSFYQGRAFRPTRSPAVWLIPQ